MTQQYLTAVYIIRTGLGNRGGKCPPCPPSSAAYGMDEVCLHNCFLLWGLRFWKKSFLPLIFSQHCCYPASHYFMLVKLVRSPRTFGSFER